MFARQGFVAINRAHMLRRLILALRPLSLIVVLTVLAPGGARAFAAQGPTAGAALGGNVSVAAWKNKPSWYLVATADRAIQPTLQRAMATTIKAKTIEVTSSHVAMLARPDETANLILEAAGLIDQREVHVA